MCGIVGYHVFQNNLQYKEDILKATSVLRHRGPDCQNVWQNEDVGLGHTRLAILDLSEAGNQPMTSYDGRYVISFNGQVYNYLELADDLNLDIDTSSDTRVILEAIAKLGVEKAVLLFNGMFALAIWDNKLKKLYLVRDSIGIKPLYWALTSDGYIFGSELKSILSFKRFNKNISEKGLNSYLQNKAIYAPHTIYNNCYKLFPGHILTVCQREHTIKAFTPKVADYSSLESIPEATNQLDVLLKESLKRHARSDVPFSAFLSGGVDSSLIVSMLSQSHKINTYSVGYEEKDYDETTYAQNVAKVLGVKHEVSVLSPSDVFESLESISELYDEPFGDASCIPTYLLSRAVSKKTKIAFSGDGADELFAGYPRYFNAINNWKKIGNIPYIIRKKILKNLIPDFPNSTIHYLASFFTENPEESLKYLKKTCDYKSISDLFYMDNYLGVPNSIYRKGESIEPVVGGLKTKSASSLKSLLLLDQQYRLPEEMLTKVDRASMANSLEIRVPFLDNEIVAFSRTIPDHLLGQSGSEKILLKQLLKKYIPREFVERKKVGFHVPLKLWLKDHYQEWAKDLLFDSQKSNKIFNEEQLKNLWNSYYKGDSQLFYPIWLVIMHNQWMRKFNI